MDYNNINYNELNEDTKLFFNRAIDVYMNIFDKHLITYMKKGRDETEEHEFTELDIKAISLFIAGHLTCGNLKNILSQYDDINLDNLCEFVDVATQYFLMPKLKWKDKYEKIYEDYFKSYLETLITSQKIYIEKINAITPEVIIYLLKHGSYNNGTIILNFFADKYGSSGLGFLNFSKHPLFKDLENYNLKNGLISKKDSFQKNNSGTSSSTFNPAPNKRDVVKPKEHLNKQQLTSVDINDDSVWLLLEEIQKKFIGQELTTEGLFYNIVNNQQLAKMNELPDGQRSIIFLDGPSGTGKTAIAREITEKLGLPFTSTSVTNYSSTGYVGGDITDILEDLYVKSNGDLEKAQRGIIVLDEFDKIAYSENGRGLEMKKAVQHQLLDFLGGGKYTVRGNLTFDTSKLTFVCLGALTDLRAQKTEKKQAIGFGQLSQQSEQEDYSITPQDLIGIGLEKELVGRFNTYLHTNDYSKEDLTRILKESTISPLISFRQWIESVGKKLEIDETVYGLIVDQAYELNTGARSLQTVVNNIRTSFIKEVLRGCNETIQLDSETVERINWQTMNRKGRS